MMPVVSWPFVNTGTYPTRSGNLVRPWIDGEPAFRRICEAIESARQVELLQEHLAADTSEMDDISALLLFRRIAQENRQRHEHSDPNWQGLAFSLDVATYGQESQF